MISYRLVSYENMHSAEFYDRAIKSHRVKIEQEFQYVECKERNEGEDSGKKRRSDEEATRRSTVPSLAYVMHP